MPSYTNKNGVLVPQASTVDPPMAASEPREFMAPIVTQWLEKIKLAKVAKEPFDTIAYQCDAFFAKSSGFMWKDSFRKKFLGQSIDAPKFEVTLNKAFELVALFGPYLFWKYPQVYIQGYEPVELTPEAFGDPQDPVVQQMFQAAMQEAQTEVSRGKTRNSLMQKYLNYSQKEQPGGGLAIHAELMITEALVKGRSPIWVEAYSYPGSDRTLTGRFWDTVDNLLIDPDARDPMLTDATWVSRQHCTPHWKLEDLFKLPRGYMRNKGSWESADSQASNRSDVAKRDRREGKSNDLVVWYEIWSKAGVGTRLNHMDDELPTMVSEGLHDSFDDVVGDFAYLCVCRNVPFPLNATRSMVLEAYDDEIEEMFQWRAANYGPPFPCWRDGRWPMVCLDFHRHYGSAWPIAPLAPAMGELVVLNVLISAFTEQAYENRKQIIAYLSSVSKDVKKSLKSSSNPQFVEINENVHKSINEVVQFLNRPDMNNDLLDAIGFISQLFDKRTGLTEIMYSMNVGGSASRTARDVAAKEEKASIRPDKMANDVAHCLTESAELEKFLAGWIVEGQDLVPLLGRYGAYFWDQLITSEDPEVFVREMKATVEANDVRKPNKERLTQNMQQMMQFMLPMLQSYATDTGNTQPLNAFVETLGNSMEQDVGKWQLGDWRPEQDPEAQEQQQMAMQLEQAKLEAELMIKQLEAQAKQAEAEKAETEAELGGAEIIKRQMEMAFDDERHEQDLDQDAEKHDLDMSQDRAKFLQDLLQKREENRAKIEQMQQEGRVKARQSKQTNGSAE